MKYLELEVVASITEILGDVELSRTVFAADSFLSGVLGRLGGICGVKSPVFRNLLMMRWKSKHAVLYEE